MKDELEALLNEILPLARFTVVGRVMGIQEYRDGYARSQTFVDGMPPSWFIHAEVEVDMVPKAKFDRLVEALRSALGSFVNLTTSRISLLTPTIMGGGMYPEPDIDRFARQAIRCGALSGSARTVDLLLSLVGGEQIRYTEMMVLRGIHQEQDRLDLQPGVRLIKLSRDGDSLFDMIPEELALKLRMQPPQHPERIIDQGWLPMEGLPGATALCIDATASPVFCERDDKTSDRPNVNRHSSLQYPRCLFIQALSLAFDSHVSVLHEWLDFDPEITLLTGAYDRPHSSPPRFPPWRVESPPLTQDGLVQARDLGKKLYRHSSDEVQVAIGRWMKSKPLWNLVDDSIDIRIALETLFYAEGENTELSLRLALRGAWYLGNDAGERSEYFEALKKAYKMCSGAVHTGSLSYRPENRDLLGKAQDICRKALLKRIDQGSAPDWTALVLNALPPH